MIMQTGRTMARSEKHAQLLAGIYGSARIAYTPEEAAVVTGRSRSRIFKAIKDGELTARKDGKATLLEDAELRRWLGSLPTIGRQPVVA
jgi:excisionase family DNA binding protein